jgi:predicted AAA+ superfamily ATPase
MGSVLDRSVPRPAYEAVLDSYAGTAPIKVLSGVRRCGKSTLLKMLADRLSDQGVPSQNILYRRLDGYDVPLQPTVEWLDALLAQAVEGRVRDAPLCVFLDEVQEVPGWERAVRRLHASGLADIYLTGSNAFLLSSDLTTYLSGRYVQIPVYPLSFGEYRDFVVRMGLGPRSDDELLLRYVRFGGMPGIFEVDPFSDTAVARQLEAVHDTVVLNDVAKRFKVRDVDLLQKLVRYVFSTSGNLFSSNKIAAALTSMGRKTNVETVDAYIDALTRAFLIYPCFQAGLGGKAVLRPQRKLYVPDAGLRNLANGFNQRDLGFAVEGVVYMELVRRGYTVSVGAAPVGEVDFVAAKGGERRYLQVCDSVANPETLARELRPLEALGDSFPKEVVVRDPWGCGTTEKGIRVVALGEWLLG